MQHWVTPTYPSGVRLRWQGVLDLPEMYRYMKRWLQDRGFVDDNGFTNGGKWTQGPDEDENTQHNLEKKYTERRQQTSKLLEIEWRASNQMTDYFRYNIWITFFMPGITEQETEQGGVKRKLDRGDFDLRMGAHVETPDGDDFESMSWMQKMNFRFIQHKRLQMHKRDLYLLFYLFHKDLRDYIKNARY